MSSALLIKFSEIIRNKATAPKEEEASLKISFQDLQQLVEHSRKLEASLAALQTVPASTPVGAAHIQDALSDVKTATSSLSPFVEGLWEQVPTSLKPTDGSAEVAQQAFNTTEVLEHILSFLPPRDMLSVEQVNKTWHATVNGSVKLKKKLRRTAQDNPGWFYSPFAEPSMMSGMSAFDGDLQFPSAYYDYYTDSWWPGGYGGKALKPVSRTSNFQFCIRGSFGEKTAPRMDKRALAISIGGPCLKSAEGNLKLHGESVWDRRATENFTVSTQNAGGLTVGDIFSAMEKIAMASDEKNKKQFKRYRLRVHCEVQLADDDPIMVFRHGVVAQLEKYIE